MKIVSWNLKNIGQTKLTNTFGATFAAFGLGNNVNDYITGLVGGSTRWSNVANLSTNMADIFVLIELKTGGNQKGYPISGTCIPTLTDVTNRLNTVVGVRYPNNPNPPFHYTYVTPVIVGYHETVGIIYNDKNLKLLSGYAFRNNKTGKWINPRTPYGGMFEILNTPWAFQVIGIHSPPPKGSNNLKYKPPIEYAVQLPTINPATMANTFIMGDFNCNPASWYLKAGAKVYPFTDLKGFGTHIPNGTLSSVRVRVANSQPPPANYLNDAYDNIMLNATLNNPREIVADLIGNSRDMNTVGNPNVSGTNLVALVNAYNKVSDHLPVVIEW